MDVVASEAGIVSCFEPRNSKVRRQDLKCSTEAAASKSMSSL